MYIEKLFKKYKLTVKDGKVYDPIREKYITLTPEEKVRQQMIKYMLKNLNIPAEKIGVEKTLDSLGDIGNKKRVDICIFGEGSEVVAVIECKADYIGKKESPYQQAINYVESLKIKSYFVVDGCEIKGYCYDYIRSQFDPLEEIPAYDKLIKL